jgi:two-component system response regulator RegA
MTDLSADVSALADKSLLVLDDDAPLRTRLGRALEQRGFEPTLVGSVSEALAAVRAHAPAFAVLDMRLEDGTGLKVVEAVRDARPDAKIIMLTGYGNIATAVAAVKAGAVNYLAKPADADDVVKALMAVAVDYLSKPADADDVARALLARGDAAPAPPENPMSADRVRWEHIQRIYELCNHNVSETARRLNMHRRTLQRILAKRAPR